jgi:fucose 4-O-acetylase-like acetyltransferase
MGMFLTTSCMGIVLAIYLSEQLKHDKLLQKWGKNSIVIYCTHFFVVKCLRLCMNFLLPGDLHTGEYPWYFILFTCVSMVEIVIIKIWDKYLVSRSAKSENTVSR